MLVRLGAGEIFGEISFLDTGDAGAGASVVAEDEVRARCCCLLVAAMQLHPCSVAGALLVTMQHQPNPYAHRAKLAHTQAAAACQHACVLVCLCCVAGWLERQAGVGACCPGVALRRARDVSADCAITLSPY